MYRRYSQTGDGAVSMTQVTRNRIKNGIILLLIVTVHIVRVGLKAGRTFDMLLCIGVGSAVAFQTFINIGMCIGITPVIGITLPFFSYGGSSMVSMFAAMGLVSGVKFKLKPQLFSIY